MEIFVSKEIKLLGFDELQLYVSIGSDGLATIDSNLIPDFCSFYLFLLLFSSMLCNKERKNNI